MRPCRGLTGTAGGSRAGRNPLRHGDRHDGLRTARRHGGSPRHDQWRPRADRVHGRHREVHDRRSAAGSVRRDLHPVRLRHRNAPRVGDRFRFRGDARRGARGAARGAGGRGRQPRAAAVRDRVDRAYRRHSLPGRRQPGQHRRRRSVADPRPVLQRQPAAGGRRGPADPPRQPARPRPGSHAGARQRQAPAPGRGHQPGSATAYPTGRRARTSPRSRPSRCGRSRCCGTARRPSTARTPSPGY